MAEETKVEKAKPEETKNTQPGKTPEQDKFHASEQAAKTGLTMVPDKKVNDEAADERSEVAGGKP